MTVGISGAEYIANVLSIIDAEDIRLELTEPLHSGVIKPIGDGELLSVSAQVR